MSYGGEGVWEDFDGWWCGVGEVWAFDAKNGDVLCGDLYRMDTKLNWRFIDSILEFLIHQSIDKSPIRLKSITQPIIKINWFNNIKQRLELNIHN